jgi:hypothetical protein
VLLATDSGWTDSSWAAAKEKGPATTSTARHPPGPPLAAVAILFEDDDDDGYSEDPGAMSVYIDSEDSEGEDYAAE